MPLDFLDVGSSPIAGYECLQPLGGSAFSSQWLVRAPDGSTRLWKAIDLAVGNAALEARNLELLIRLKHPSLNPLLEYHTIAERRALILETAAPLKSLRDRLRELKHQANPGIPLHELAPWILSVADGLDFLNAPTHDFQGKKVAIYHRELRPENMLLFRESSAMVCKVGDFGLAKPVADQSNQHSQGLANYDYDPPEFYEGTTSPSCDQYSLAISCYELRTGKLPFTGSILEQLTARLNDTPNLDAVDSEAERAALRRALSKDPKKRFATCREFARAWVHAMNNAEAAKSAPAESPSMRLRRTPPRPSAPAADSTAVSQLRVSPRPNGRELPPPIAVTAQDGPGSASRMLPPRSSVYNGEPEHVEPERPPSLAFAPVPAPPGSEENDISAIIRRAVEAASPTAVAEMPREEGSLRMRRALAPQAAAIEEHDQKVPVPWVIIISMIVLGAVGVIARELVLQNQQQQQAAPLTRTVEDQSNRTVIN